MTFVSKAMYDQGTFSCLFGPRLVKWSLIDYYRGGEQNQIFLNAKKNHYEIGKGTFSSLFSTRLGNLVTMIDGKIDR